MHVERTHLLLEWRKFFPSFRWNIQCSWVIIGIPRPPTVFLKRTLTSEAKNDQLKHTSCTSAKNEYASSVAFFSLFLSCSRRSAAVKNAFVLPDIPSAVTTFFPPVLCFPDDFAFAFAFCGLSSSEDSSEGTVDRREAVERDEDDFTDLTSVSESGTMKSSSSSDAFDRDFRTEERMS